MKGLKFAALGVLLLSSHTFARDLWTGETPSDGEDASIFKLASALKFTALATAPPSDPSLPQSASGLGLLRLRLTPQFKSGPWTVEAAYDNHLSYASTSVASSLAVPSYVPAPYRFFQLGGNIQSGRLNEAQELDRGYVSYASQKLDLTLGRQPIGWGHGKLFSAVDIIAPFSPLIVDQEWRRGVDAIRADYKITDTTSVELIATGGTSWDQTALGGRIRGFIGPIDGEVLVAKRAQDMMYGITTSATIGGAEVHAEFAAFDTPGDLGKTWIPKALLGISNNFNIGNGLQISLEYHYSGFGASSATQISSLLADVAFQNRFIRGDSQILGTQVLGLLGTYTVNGQWTLNLTVLQSLIDFSAVIAPSAVWEFSESASLMGSVFIAYGAGSQNGVYQSQYGSVSPTAIIQFRFYD